MLRTKYNDICLCGHYKITHGNRFGECTANLPPLHTIKKGLYGTIFCGCDKFVLDNLKWVSSHAK